MCRQLKRKVIRLMKKKVFVVIAGLIVVNLVIFLFVKSRNKDKDPILVEAEKLVGVGNVLFEEAESSVIGDIVSYKIPTKDGRYIYALHDKTDGTVHATFAAADVSELSAHEKSVVEVLEECEYFVDFLQLETLQCVSEEDDMGWTIETTDNETLYIDMNTKTVTKP